MYSRPIANKQQNLGYVAAEPMFLTTTLYSSQRRLLFEVEVEGKN